MDKKVDIFSDVDFSGYQHVNQMLYHNLKSQGVNVTFLHRFLMSNMKFTYIKRIIHSILSHLKKKFSKSKQTQTLDPGVKRIFNLPSVNAIVDQINYSLVSKQLTSKHKDIAITFLPSLALKKTFSEYSSLIYYCVHDSVNQSYSDRNKCYENKLVSQCKVVFCDNESVLARLAGERGYSSILSDNYLSNKFILVPPPVPKEFYDDTPSNKIYDLVYFGSIHKDIDIERIKKISLKKSILIISFQQFEFTKEHNITFSPGINDFQALVGKIKEAAAILFPYKNTEFMQTISPAKLYQSIALDMPIYCSNNFLCEKFGLMKIINNDIQADSSQSFNLEYPIECYSDSNIVERIREMILSDALS